jgi:hypothetical protein
LPPQVEAEQYFVGQKIIHPVHYPRYWIGLNSSASAWPKFKWIDGWSPGPADYDPAYTNWGTDSAGGSEPNNGTAGFCAVADYLEAKNVTSNVTFAWGWNDQDCSLRRPSLCWQPPRECGELVLAKRPADCPAAGSQPSAGGHFSY